PPEEVIDTWPSVVEASHFSITPLPSYLPFSSHCLLSAGALEEQYRSLGVESKKSKAAWSLQEGTVESRETTSASPFIQEEGDIRKGEHKHRDPHHITIATKKG
ncbi:hypothetical protein KUCAC02_014555, partial [Chaenocephalus aceratus]